MMVGRKMANAVGCFAAAAVVVAVGGVAAAGGAVARVMHQVLV